MFIAKKQSSQTWTFKLRPKNAHVTAMERLMEENSTSLCFQKSVENADVRLEDHNNRLITVANS
jgi:hypothetical protein